MAIYYNNQLRNYYYGGNKLVSGTIDQGLMYYGNVQVNPGIVLDDNAEEFILATGISGSTANAINQLVISLKNDNLWNEMYAIYPLVGGTFNSCKYNLKDINTYTLTIDGNAGPSFNVNGVTFSGTGDENSGLLDTGFADSSSIWTYNDASMGYYINTGFGDGTFRRQMGCNTGSVSGLPGTNIGVDGTSINSSIKASLGISTNTISGSTVGIDVNFEGLYSVSANISTTTIYKNGTSVNSIPVVSSPGFDYSNQTILIGGVRNQRVLVGRFAFAYVGAGLNNTQIANLNTIVETFQTTLGRQAV